ncbi:alpha/beta hydrolase domain-containing protein [Nocardioides sp. SYSU DS0651]|uniref:alpha/beta hydrolase domain-containing protein n=1 Tax=Nocardioides sp. SYSU DS0651 TaxID=3415955 RepID=UPI003F4C7945
MTHDRVTFTPLTGGHGIALTAARPGPDLAAAGWAEQEYAAAGTAVRYAADVLPADGRFALREAGDEAAFVTRVVVRRPVTAAFSGTLVVEWLNVSSGADAAPDWTYLAEELLRRGHAWAGVSAQHNGVEGGAAVVAVEGAALHGLKSVDPDRYGALAHPGDAYAYSLFTEVARALAGAADGGPLDGLAVERVLAVGESQSAYLLTTYVNGVQPITGAFDGFLVHSRGEVAAPLGEAGRGVDLAAARAAGRPTRLRTDLDVPVLVVQAEGDLFGRLNYLPARQPDADRLRVWEIAGAAHADLFQIGEFEAFLGCPDPVNRGQQAYVVRAALRHLDRWARGGPAAPSAEPLAVTGGDLVVDEVGNARGGVRTPAVDAPVQVLSGRAAPGASVICSLFGRTLPIEPGLLAARWSSRAAYLAAYEDATDAAVAAGFVLPEDRAAVLAEARPDLLPG